MNANQKEANDLSKSEKANDENKSEEFLNFERGMKRVLGLNKEQVKEVIRKTPSPKKDETGNN
jgi:hypothetical protein